MAQRRSSTCLLSGIVIDPVKAADVFKRQRDDLKLVFRNDLPNIAHKLYVKSIISEIALEEATNLFHIPTVRALNLLSVIQDRIRTEAHVFTEFVNILELEQHLRFQAQKLVARYLGTCSCLLINYHKYLSNPNNFFRYHEV